MRFKFISLMSFFDYIVYCETRNDCSSELGESDLASETNLNYGEFVEHPFSWEFELPPSILLNSTCTSSDRG